MPALQTVCEIEQALHHKGNSSDARHCSVKCCRRVEHWAHYLMNAVRNGGLTSSTGIALASCCTTRDTSALLILCPAPGEV